MGRCLAAAAAAPVANPQEVRQRRVPPPGLISAHHSAPAIRREGMAPTSRRAAESLLAAARHLVGYSITDTNTSLVRRKALPSGSTNRLQASLARSFDDGTSAGADRAKHFLRLSSLVCSGLRKRHYLRTVALHEAYRGHDPGESPTAISRDGQAASTSSRALNDRASAAAFCETLHWSLLSAGFQLCSREDELRALNGHFGDEQVR